MALSSSVFDPAIPYAYQLGANSFLAKPEDFTGSLASLRHVLEFWLEGQEDVRQAA